jgi:hypothetical protein
MPQLAPLEPFVVRIEWARLQGCRAHYGVDVPMVWPVRLVFEPRGMVRAAPGLIEISMRSANLSAPPVLFAIWSGGPGMRYPLRCLRRSYNDGCAVFGVVLPATRDGIVTLDSIDPVVMNQAVVRSVREPQSEPVVARGVCSRCNQPARWTAWSDSRPEQFCQTHAEEEEGNPKYYSWQMMR